MDMLWLDIVNSDWRGYRGGEPARDLLLQPGWLEQRLSERGVPIQSPLQPEAISALQTLRTFMQHVIDSLTAGHTPSEQDIEAFNAYLSVPTMARLVKSGERFQIEQAPLERNWHWPLREVAASFATFLAEHDYSNLKRCSNPACRWVYYDESRKKNRCWCNEACANLMRVRRYRSHHHAAKEHLDYASPSH